MQQWLQRLRLYHVCDGRSRARGGTLLKGYLLGYNFIADSGECVELAHDADDRFAAPLGGDEGCGHTRNPGLDLESVLLQLVLE